jgi:hypothetical protein
MINGDDGMSSIQPEYISTGMNRTNNGKKRLIDSY